MVDIVLLEPEHEGNVGAVSRVMANFGFDKLVVVNPQCDLKSDDFFKRAKHSKIKVVVRKKIPKYNVLVGTTAKISTDYNVARTPIFPEQLAEKIIGLKKVGLLFGREGDGLRNDEVELCDFLCIVNASKKYATLNLSHAVAIILYEIHKRQKKAKIADDITPARDIDKKQLQKMMNRVIDNHNFGGEHKQNVQKKIWKNVFNKAILTKREAFGMMGLLNKLKNRR